MATREAIPRMLIGTLNFSKRVSEQESIELLVAAHDAGVAGINIADSDYSGRSETYVGKHLQRLSPADRPFLMLELSGVDMGVPHDPNLTPQYLRKACERSLLRLRSDSVNRVVIPRPSLRTPLEETLAGVQELIIGPGLAESYGVSTFPAWLTCHGQHVCQSLNQSRISSELAPYNILDRRAENELIPNAQFWSMDFFAWAGLAQGLLAGRYPCVETFPPDSRAAVLGGIYAQRANMGARIAASQFVELSQEFSYTPATAALAWLLTRTGVSGVVVGPRVRSHLTPMRDALALRLDPAFQTRVDAINPPGSAKADFFNSAPWMLQHV